MGFNISGIAINKNYENNLVELQKHFGWSLQKDSKVNFETASENWKEPNLCDIYFTENGTLIFISADKCMDEFPIKEFETLSFILSETSMSMYLNYCVDGVSKRSIMETEGTILEEEGDPLPLEENAEDTSEIIWQQIAKLIGVRYFDIELGSEATRYMFN